MNSIVDATIDKIYYTRILEALVWKYYEVKFIQPQYKGRINLFIWQGQIFRVNNNHTFYDLHGILQLIHNLWDTKFQHIQGKDKYLTSYNSRSKKQGFP